MENKIKVLGIILLAGFSFYYTDKVSSIIKNSDPIMKRIKEEEKNMIVSKVDRVVIKDEFITGLNGCIVDEKESYNKMKSSGEYKEELLVMKEDPVKKNDNLYIIGGNKEKRNISIILLNTNYNLSKYTKKNNIKINYFLDGDYLINNIDKIIKISNYSYIYNYGRNNKYLSKYIVYDNSIIQNNFNNNSNYCLVSSKDDKVLNLCNKYNMKTIKKEYINKDIYVNTKELLENGQIFVYSNYKYDELVLTINYILSKGYNIVSLDELLSEKTKCN